MCLVSVRSSGSCLLIGKCKEAGTERQHLRIDGGGSALPIWEGKKRLSFHSGTEVPVGVCCWRISLEINSVCGAGGWTWCPW